MLVSLAFVIATMVEFAIILIINRKFSGITQTCSPTGNVFSNKISVTDIQERQSHDKLESTVMPETEDVMKQTAISVYDIEDYPKSSIQFLKDIL
jgi:hypothetical protein